MFDLIGLSLLWIHQVQATRLPEPPAPQAVGATPAYCAVPSGDDPVTRAALAMDRALPRPLRLANGHSQLTRPGGRRRSGDARHLEPLPGQNGRVIELARAADGLFYLDGQVNGHPVRFLVDTGATSVVLTGEDAARIGIEPAAADDQVVLHTAGGARTLPRVRLERIGYDGLQSEGLSATVAKEGLAISLLGQAWLSRLASVTIRGDRMTLQP